MDVAFPNSLSFWDNRSSDKGVQCNNKCPHCDQTEENEWHCFFGCNTAQDVWKETEDGTLVLSHIENARGFVDMIFELLEKIETERMARITMILWTLWWRRNQRCWHDKIPTILEVIRRARDMHQSWLNMQGRNKHADGDITTPATYSWSKPSNGKIKCNVDTACYAEDNTFCVGACSRDEQGRFMKSYVTRFQGTPSIAEAEAT